MGLDTDKTNPNLQINALERQFKLGMDRIGNGYLPLIFAKINDFETFKDQLSTNHGVHTVRVERLGYIEDASGAKQIQWTVGIRLQNAEQEISFSSAGNVYVAEKVIYSVNYPRLDRPDDRRNALQVTLRGLDCVKLVLSAAYNGHAEFAALEERQIQEVKNAAAVNRQAHKSFHFEDLLAIARHIISPQ